MKNKMADNASKRFASAGTYLNTKFKQSDDLVKISSELSVILRQ